MCIKGRLLSTALIVLNAFETSCLGTEVSLEADFDRCRRLFQNSQAQDTRASIALGHPQLIKREGTLAFTNVAVVCRASSHHDAIM